MTLFEINAALENAIEVMLNSVDEETGELNQMDVEVYEQLQLMKEEKLEGIALYIKSLDAEAKAINDEVQNLRKRSQSVQNKADRLREFLATNLNGEKFKTARCSVSYRKSTSIFIPDESMVPKKYLRVKTEPDKTAIKQAILNGIKVKGCAMVDKENMVIK